MGAKRRVRTRRHGPPQLQFVTATDLSHFRGEDAKRSVRSQAMIYHRSRSTTIPAVSKLAADKAGPRRRRKGPVTKGPTSTKQVRSTDGQDEMQDKGRSSLALGTSSATLTCASSDEEEHGRSTTVTLRQHPRDQQYFVFAAHKEAPWPMPESEENLSDTTSDVTTDHDSSSCGQQLVRDARVRNTIPRPTGRVVKYEYTDTQEERQIRRLLAKIVPIRPFGDAVDPFGIIPRYKTPGVDSLLLTRACKYQHD